MSWGMPSTVSSKGRPRPTGAREMLGAAGLGVMRPVHPALCADGPSRGLTAGQKAMLLRYQDAFVSIDCRCFTDEELQVVADFFVENVIERNVILLLKHLGISDKACHRHAASDIPTRGRGPWVAAPTDVRLSKLEAREFRLDRGFNALRRHAIDTAAAAAARAGFNALRDHAATCKGRHLG